MFFQRVVIIGRKVGLSGTLGNLLDPNCLQTLIAGRKSRERERERERERDCTVFAHKSFVLALFLNIQTQCLGQTNNLVTTASDEDSKPKLIVRIGFCTAKLDIPQY